jgi:precorrin-2 dehydrogenase/sirohydrochlorin ferrochelatase
LNYYPSFLNLIGKRAVVIGGGRVAERKILTLLKADARVTVISPQLTKRIEKEKRKNNIKHISRHYRKGDLKNAFIIIAATDSQAINKHISEDALCLVNVVDAPSLCNFIVPSVVKRGPLTIAISTSGVSPAFSKSIRKELEKLYSSEFSRYLKFLEKFRKKAVKEIPDKTKRAAFLKSLASKEIIDMLRRRGFEETKKCVLSQYIKRL